MSIHASLKVKSALLRARNVYTRGERLAELQKTGEWAAGKTVYGLRKVATVKGGKKKGGK